jgi:hypothetical protein
MQPGLCRCSYQLGRPRCCSRCTCAVWQKLSDSVQGKGHIPLPVLVLCWACVACVLMVCVCVVYAEGIVVHMPLVQLLL